MWVMSDIPLSHTVSKQLLSAALWADGCLKLTEGQSLLGNRGR